MKRTLQNLSMLLLTFIVGMGSVWAQDETVFYTMDCPASTDIPAHSTYAAMYETVVNNITWQAPGNQYEDQAWRLGGKSLNGVDRYMYTVDAIETTVSKVVVSHGDISGATVNSFSLNVYSSAALAAAGGNGDVSSITGEYTANEDYTFTCPVDADWTNCYYRFTWNITVTQSGNKYIKLSSITFYQSDNSSVQQNPCATPTFSPEGGVYTTDQSVKLNSATEGTTIYYTIDGTTPTLNSLKYEGSIPVSETTTIKAIAVKEGMDVSKVASATFVFCQHAGNDKDPYNVDDARTAIDANTGITDVYATGIVSEIVTAYSDQYSNITFDIVTNNGDEVSLHVYRCGGDDAANVKVGDVVVVKGNLTTYGNIYEFAQGCELVSRESTDDRIETYISFDGVENDDNGAQVVNYELGEDFIAPTATLLNLDDDSEIPGVTFSYSSDNEKVATVTDNGITIIGAGTAVITVSYEGSDVYQPCEQTYTINVTANGGDEKQYPEYSVTGLESVYTNGEFQFTVETEAPGLQVKLEQTDLAELIPGEETGHYTLKTNGSEGGIILTITTEADDTYDALNKMYNVTIVYSQGGGEEPQPVVEDYYVHDILNKEFTGVTGNTYTKITGKTDNSDAVYAGQCAGGNSSIQLRSKKSDSGVVTTVSGGKVKKVTVTWNSNTTGGRVLQVYVSNTPFTDAKQLYNVAEGIVLAGELETTETELEIEGDYEYVGFRSKTDALYLDEVDIAWEVTYTRDVAEGDYGTLCLPRKAYVSGATVYEIAGVVKDDDKLTDLALAEHTGALEAGVAYVFHATSTQVVATLVGEAVAEAAQTTGLVGNLSAEDIKTPDGCYVLVDGVLRQVQGGTAYIQTNRAYFNLDDVAEYSEDEPTAGVKLINISFNEDATAINGINATTADGTIYNLQGQRVNSLQRGINVVNGKKVLVK